MEQFEDELIHSILRNETTVEGGEETEIKDFTENGEIYDDNVEDICALDNFDGYLSNFSDSEILDILILDDVEAFSKIGDIPRSGICFELYINDCLDQGSVKCLDFMISRSGRGERLWVYSEICRRNDPKTFDLILRLESELGEIDPNHIKNKNKEIYLRILKNKMIICPCLRNKYYIKALFELCPEIDDNEIKFAFSCHIKGYEHNSFPDNLGSGFWILNCRNRDILAKKFPEEYSKILTSLFTYYENEDFVSSTDKDEIHDVILFMKRNKYYHEYSKIVNRMTFSILDFDI